MAGIQETAKLLSTPQDKLDEPPVEKEVEAQEAQAKEQEAIPETKNAEPETPKDGDTETPIELHKVKVDGEELEVDYDELKKGYSREQHYQKKAKDLAKEREDITLKTTELDSKLEDAKTIVDDELSKLDSDEMLELKEDNPEQYLKEVDRINAKVKKFNALKESRQKELDAKNDGLLVKERAALIEAFPEWGDDAVMAKEAPVLLNALGELGYSENELNNITDHRMFVLANKALKYDEILSTDLEAKTVKPKPKQLNPGVTTTTNPESNALKDAQAKFGKSGNWKDAAKLLSMK